MARQDASCHVASHVASHVGAMPYRTALGNFLASSSALVRFVFCPGVAPSTPRTRRHRAPRTPPITTLTIASPSRIVDDRRNAALHRCSRRRRTMVVQAVTSHEQRWCCRRSAQALLPRGREDAAHTWCRLSLHASRAHAPVLRAEALPSYAFIYQLHTPSYGVSASYISFIQSFIQCIRAYQCVSG
jgi:hypothetical protein